jgi:hypothetical protein
VQRLILAATVVLAGCAKNIQNAEAVKQGVMDYLKERAPTMGLNMDAMDANVTSVSFEKDVARAAVSFVVKGTSGGGMNMDYVLDRKGDKWVVRGRQVSPASQHGSEALPGGAPRDLPPGHPPTENKQ